LDEWRTAPGTAWKSLSPEPRRQDVVVAVGEAAGDRTLSDRKAAWWGNFEGNSVRDPLEAGTLDDEATARRNGW